MDGSSLVEIGDCGIVDYDNRWSVQTTRWRCEHGHIIFVAGAAVIDNGENAAADPPIPIDQAPEPKKPHKDDVVQEFPPVGKYRVRLLRDPKTNLTHVDIREYVSSDSFEGFTRRGIKISIKALVDQLRDSLSTILAGGSLK